MTTLPIPKTMLAWRKWHNSQKPTRDEVPVPTAPEDGLLVEIHAAGVCHSDVTIVDQLQPPPGFRNPEAFTMGHEGCGEIVDVGSKVTRFKVGEMVAIIAMPGCGESTCEECSKGLTQLCGHGDHYGLDTDGFFAPYVAVKEAAAIRLPQGVSAAAAAVATDAITTAYHAVVDRAQVKAGETVFLHGLGGLGFNALQILHSIGARVIAADQRQTVLDEAVKFGVAQGDIVPPDSENVAAWISDKGIAIDKAIDFVCVPKSFSAAVDTVKYGGKVVLVGLFAKSLPLNSHAAVFKHIDILGSMGGTMKNLGASLELIAKGHVTPQLQVDSMANLPSVLHDLHAGKIVGRVALIPEGMEGVSGTDQYRTRVSPN